MRTLTVLIAGAGLLACNGGSDNDTPAAGADTAPTAASNSAVASGAAEVANSVRETVAAFESNTSTTTSTLTIRPTSARDPGPRAGNGSAGMPLPGLTPPQLAAFNAGKEDFEEAEEVDEGLGPTMNLDGCGGCHSQPAIGGTSPAGESAGGLRQQGRRDQPGAAVHHRRRAGARGALRAGTPDGSPDGGVHALFTIAGRAGAAGCNLAQPDFARQLANRNVVFRIPTPVFGAGLIEADSRQRDLQEPDHAGRREAQPRHPRPAQLRCSMPTRSRPGQPQWQRRHRSAASAGRRRTSRC